MRIIDPPVTPFSPPAQIEAWFKKLETAYPQDDPDIQEAITDAKKDLEFARSLVTELHQEPLRQAA